MENEYIAHLKQVGDRAVTSDRQNELSLLPVFVKIWTMNIFQGLFFLIFSQWYIFIYYHLRDGCVERSGRIADCKCFIIIVAKSKFCSHAITRK